MSFRSPKMAEKTSQSARSIMQDARSDGFLESRKLCQRSDWSNDDDGKTQPPFHPAGANNNRICKPPAPGRIGAMGTVCAWRRPFMMLSLLVSTALVLGQPDSSNKPTLQPPVIPASTSTNQPDPKT